MALRIFYGSHLDLVSRRLSGGVAGEIAYTVELMRQYPDPDEPRLDPARPRTSVFDLEMRLEPGAILPHEPRVNVLGPMDDDLEAALAQNAAAAVHHGLGDAIRNRC